MVFFSLLLLVVPIALLEPLLLPFAAVVVLKQCILWILPLTFCFFHSSSQRQCAVFLFCVWPLLLLPLLLCQWYVIGGFAIGLPSFYATYCVYTRFDTAFVNDLFLFTCVFYCSVVFVFIFSSIMRTCVSLFRVRVCVYVSVRLLFANDEFNICLYCWLNCKSQSTINCSSVNLTPLKE